MKANRESSWRRAWNDSERFRTKSALWYWGVGLVGSGSLGVVAAIMSASIAPTNASDSKLTAYTGIGGLIGLVAGFGLFYTLVLLWNFLRAPYRQRNEAWSYIDSVPDSLQAPIFLVKPRVDGNRAILEVANDPSSPSAHFHATAEILEGSSYTERIEMYWEGHAHSEVLIYAGEKKSVFVAEVKDTTLMFADTRSYELILHRIGVNGLGSRSVAHWTWNTPEAEMPAIKLSIGITSDPASDSQSPNREYCLKVSNRMVHFEESD